MKSVITINNFTGGLAPSRYYGDHQTQSDPGDGTIYSRGFDPTMQWYENVLRRSYGTAPLSNASFILGETRYAKAISREGLGSYVYLLANNDDTSGLQLHRIDSQGASVSSSGAWPHTVATTGGYGQGMEFYNNYLWYGHGKYLGRYDLSTTFNDSFNISLNVKALNLDIDHPMVQGNGKLWIGNSNGSGPIITSVDASDIVSSAALDLSSISQVIKALDFDKNFLFIATSSKETADTSDFSSPATMYVWDTISSGWQESFQFPEPDITCIKAFGGTVFATGKRGLYRFTGSGFEKVTDYIVGPPTAGGMDTSPDGKLYVKMSQAIGAYGSLDSRYPPIFHVPYSDTGGENSFIKWASNTELYTGGYISHPRVKRFSSLGTTFTTGYWGTPMIPFGKETRLLRIKVDFLPLANGTTFDVKWAKDDGSTAVALGTVTGTGTETSWQYSPNGLTSYAWQIRIEHTAGTSPFIRQIELEVENETD
jgi:hypothetical protein